MQGKLGNVVSGVCSEEMVTIFGSQETSSSITERKDGRIDIGWFEQFCQSNKLFFPSLKPIWVGVSVLCNKNFSCMRQDLPLSLCSSHDLYGTFQVYACLSAIEFNLLRKGEEKKEFEITGPVSHCSGLFTHFISFHPFIFFICTLQMRKLGLKKVYTLQMIGNRTAIQPLFVGFECLVLCTAFPLW